MTEDLIQYVVRRMDKQDDMLTRIEVRQDEQDTKIGEIKEVLVKHTTREEEFHPHIAEMTQMWRHSKALAWMMTKLTAFIAGFVGLWAGLKDHMK
jgi:uncharacterized coiled-coil protein SlyX